jgi:hypothetical protein
MKLFGRKGNTKDSGQPAKKAEPAPAAPPAAAPRIAAPAATARSPLGDDDYNYGSPVERVALSDPPGTTPTITPMPAAAPPPPAAPAGPARAVEPERPRFGIDDAIRLMRALPVNENPELVVQVLKTTLESLQIQLEDIIDQASLKEKTLDLRLTNLRREISQLEADIQQRKDEIVQVDREIAETSAVRQQLLLAERKTEGQGGTNGIPSGKNGTPGA